MRKLLPLLVILSPALLTSLPSFARDREVSAAGQCTRVATPDRGQVILTAEAQDKDLQRAARKATEIYDRAVQAIKRLNMEDLELRTVEYQLQEVREWEKERMVSKGFRARMGLKVATSSLSKLGEVIEIAAREEIKDVSALTTYLSPEKLRKEQFACLEIAAEDARSKAEKLAVSLKAKLGDVITISETHQIPEPPRPFMAMAEAAAPRMKTAMPAPQIEAGQQEISVQVQAVFGLKSP